MSLKTLKWVAIVLPLVFVGATDAFRRAIFPDQLFSASSLAFFYAFLTIGVFLFSHVVFSVIARLQGRILERNRHLAALNSIAAVAGETPDLHALLNAGLDHVLDVMRVESGLICTVDLAREEHSAVAARGFSPDLIRRVSRAKLGQDPVANEVVRTGRPVVIEHCLQDPRVAEAARREGIHSTISVPLKSHGEITGILVVASRKERRFTDADQELLASVGSQLGMAIRNASLYERSLQRNREMEALLVVSRAVAESLDLPQVLDRALAPILEITSADAAEIWLTEDGRELVLKCHRGAASDIFHARTHFLIGEGFPGLAAQTGSTVVTHDLAVDPRFLRGEIREAGFQTYCALPLLHRDRLVGVLGVAARAHEALTRPEELRLLAGIGEVVSVAIENTRLYERVQDAAVLEERERIAREMHDGLAQVLGYINTKSLAIRKLLASGHVLQAQDELAQMEDAARDVYADVREAILGLRSSPRSEGGLLPSLQRYLERYQEITGIQTRMEVRGPAEAVRLSPSAEIQVMRIVQEAMSNVRKHAAAGVVTVGFETVGDTLHVAVTDDGRGFDPEQLPLRGWPRFGLQTMRERAEAIGGRFRVESRPGLGTSVMVNMPIMTGEKVYASPAGR